MGGAITTHRSVNLLYLAFLLIVIFFTVQNDKTSITCDFQVRIHSFLERTNRREKIVAQTQDDLSKETNMLKKRVIKLIKRKRLREVQKLVKDEEIKSWSRDAQAKVFVLQYYCFFVINYL